MNKQRLIAEIYKRPVLWDFQSEEYKCRAKIPESWVKVAKGVGSNVTVAECKRKWKNLRDAYRAEVKRIEIRIEKDKLEGKFDPKNYYGSKWAYFENMKFIKDITKPRRKKIVECNNSSSNDNCEDEDVNAADEFWELHDIDGIKEEPDIGIAADSYSLDEENDTKCTPMQTYGLLKETENPWSTEVDPQQPTPAVKSDSTKNQNSTEDRSHCKCPKRSYEQVNFLENLEKEEQNLMKSTRLDMTRSNDLSHVGDSDYNFLVSFLPQLKKMNELQNLQFRAKMTENMLRIISQSMTSDTRDVSSLQNGN